MNPWLRAYLDTLVYHDQTFRKITELEWQLNSIWCALEALNNDIKTLLLRTRGRGLYGGSARGQAEALKGRSHNWPQKTLGVEL